MLCSFLQDSNQKWIVLQHVVIGIALSFPAKLHRGSLPHAAQPGRQRAFKWSFPHIRHSLIMAHKSNQVIGWVLKVLKPLIVGLYLLRLYRYKYIACLCLMTEHASASWSQGIPSHATLVTLVTPVNPYFGGVNWNQHEITWTPVGHVPTEQRASLGRARLMERAIA